MKGRNGPLRRRTGKVNYRKQDRNLSGRRNVSASEPESETAIRFGKNRISTLSASGGTGTSMQADARTERKRSSRDIPSAANPRGEYRDERRTGARRSAQTGDEGENAERRVRGI